VKKPTCIGFFACAENLQKIDLLLSIKVNIKALARGYELLESLIKGEKNG
jgi:hypothetical protein